MATGYTHVVTKNPNLTFTDFASKCARGMGAFIGQRDDSSDAAPIWQDKVGSYYKRALKKAKAEVARLSKMNKARRAKHIEEQRDQKRAYYLRSIGEAVVNRLRYTKMLLQVNAWQPPTPDHVGFKKFMIEQLTSSIKFDCDRDWLQQELNKLDGKSDDDLWQDLLAEARRHLKYAEESLADEKERTAERNAWKLALAQSIGINIAA
jgi:hypothetical protein